MIVTAMTTPVNRLVSLLVGPTDLLHFAHDFVIEAFNASFRLRNRETAATLTGWGTCI